MRISESYQCVLLPAVGHVLRSYFDMQNICNTVVQLLRKGVRLENERIAGTCRSVIKRERESSHLFDGKLRNQWLESDKWIVEISPFRQQILVIFAVAKRPTFQTHKSFRGRSCPRGFHWNFFLNAITSSLNQNISEHPQRVQLFGKIKYFARFKCAECYSVASLQHIHSIQENRRFLMTLFLA